MEHHEETLQRLHSAIAYLKDIGKIHKQQDIANDLDMTKGRVSDALKGLTGKFTDGFLRRFATAYGHYINKEWLLTGNGRMAMPGDDERPHIDSVEAAAGYLGGFSEQVINPPFRRAVDLLPSYDFTMRAVGDSMLPEIHSGDVLFCRHAILPLSDADLGRIFVIDTREGVAVKRLTAISPSGLLTLHSLNPDFTDYTAASSSVLALARVVALFHPID